MNTPMTVSVTATCWTPDCDEQIAVIPGTVTYWCQRHHDERRARITAAMARLENDSYGIPRKRPGTHDITIREGYDYRSERDVWFWGCSCGKGGFGSRTEGLARAASYRHLRAVEKAAERA